MKLINISNTNISFTAVKSEDSILFNLSHLFNSNSELNLESLTIEQMIKFLILRAIEEDERAILILEFGLIYGLIPQDLKS